MKKVITGIVGVVVIYLWFCFTVNEIWRKNEESDIITWLTYINLYEPYVAHYNNGNRLYNMEDYEGAKKEYENALNFNIPKDKICSVRINHALAELKLLDPQDKNLKSKLQSIRRTLYNDDCAHEDNDSGDPNAEKLEEEIKKLEEQDSEPDEGGDDKPNEKPDEKPNDDTSEKEKELNERNKDAEGEREENLENYKEFGNYDFYHGKTW